MDKELIERVYLSALGELIVPVEGVENAFCEGSVCDKSYEEMLAAYARLRTRLQVCEEDDDVEVIINSLRRITEQLCHQMFLYGWKLYQEKGFQEGISE